jgi:hypothetical protein
VSEIFDHWDNTFQMGNDIEYSAVIVVLIAGAVIGFADLAAIALRAVSATAYLLPLFAASPLAAPSLDAFIGQWWLFLLTSSKGCSCFRGCIGEQNAASVIISISFALSLVSRCFR